MKKRHIELTVDGKQMETLAEPRELLIHVLRERLGLTGPHIGCETSHCRACTVDLNGKSVKSCTIFAAQANGATITAIEGIAGPGSRHVLQVNFREHHGLQCGFCTPAMITRAWRLLQENPTPNAENICFGMAGNLCRRAGYQNIVKSILTAASELTSAREAAQ